MVLESLSNSLANFYSLLTITFGQTRGKKTFTILQNDKESVASTNCVKSAYLDKFVTENTTSAFHPDPPVNETEKPMPVTRGGRHSEVIQQHWTVNAFWSPAPAHCKYMLKFMTVDLIRKCTGGKVVNMFAGDFKAYGFNNDRVSRMVSSTE
ncbi:hypothetical protein ACTXT7_010872 [Hymenolepis weldensis]